MFLGSESECVSVSVARTWFANRRTRDQPRRPAAGEGVCSLTSLLEEMVTNQEAMHQELEHLSDEGIQTCRHRHDTTCSASVHVVVLVGLMCHYCRVSRCDSR